MPSCRPARPLGAVAASLALVAVLLPTRSARACQDLPQVSCDVQPVQTVVAPGQAFDVVFSMTNLSVDPTTGGPRLPYADDAEFTITILAGEAWSQGECRPLIGPAPYGTLPASPQTVLLDDAWSPFADGPTSYTQVFRIYPPPDPVVGYGIQAWAVSADGSRQCVSETCVEVRPSGDPPRPWAELTDPVQSGDGGSILPFGLLVHRDGYEPTHPLRVQVEPANFSDPIDIFPVDPPALADGSAAGGVLVTGEDELVTFTCHCHFPCFVGASNVYTVSITDDLDPLVSWVGRFVGKAFVDRSPTAGVELVEILDASGDGALEACEPAQVHLRLIARNPFAATPVDDVRLELPLPAGVVPLSWSFHFHDNPMDAVDPTPLELAATGTAGLGPSSFSVFVTRLASRYEIELSHPPMFRDMFEVELLLQADVLEGATSLDFAGFTVTGTAAGVPKSETAPALSIPVAPPPAPGEVAPAALRMQPDKVTIAWDPGGAARFDVYRGVLADLAPGAYGDCLQSGATTASVVDAAMPGRGHGFFYLVAGEACGTDGSLGADSLGRARVPAGACP